MFLVSLIYLSQKIQVVYSQPDNILLKIYYTIPESREKQLILLAFPKLPNGASTVIAQMKYW